MRLLDFYPSQGSFFPGETITFFIEIEAAVSETIKVQVFVQHLTDHPICIEEIFQLSSGQQTVQVHWASPVTSAGYSARLEINTINETFHAATAFDVLSSWSDFPRYGFLTDFSASRSDPEIVLQKLMRFHINGLQFYDWQYRHDQLLAPTENYIDPLGREMSLDSIRKLVNVAHNYRVACMPYLAVYAASADFWRLHPDWALYNEKSEPIPFGENFLGLMDPSAGSSWSKHLLDEGAHALREIPFDGLHIDQYGEPKQAWDSKHNPVDIPRAFVDFIQDASDQHPDKTILFNAVGNWPIEALAESAVDFMYIEIWPPDVEYLHLAKVVLDAVERSHGKPVVIAHYLPASRPENNLLTDAVILACGGTRIELGENARLLSDPYFPKHEELSTNLFAALRQFSDFAVRNGEWLGSYALSSEEKEAWAIGELNSRYVSTEESVMTVVRKHSKKTILTMVNFSDLDLHQRWDEVHNAPTPQHNLSIKIQLDKKPSHVFWDCPEITDCPLGLKFEYSNGIMTVQIPQINYIGLVSIHE